MISINKYYKFVFLVLFISIAFTSLYVIITSIIATDAFHAYVFLFHIGEFYPYFLLMSIALLFFNGILLKRIMSDGHTSLLVLFLAILLSASSYFFGFLNFDHTETINFRQTRLFQLQVLSQSISVFLFYLHYELNSFNRPRTPFLSTIIVLFWPYSLLNIFYLVTDRYPDELIFEIYGNVTLFLLQIGVIIVFSWLLINAFSVSKNFFTRGNQRDNLLISVQLSGIIILVIGVLFQFIENVTDFKVYHTPLNVIAILLIGIPYFIDPQILLFAPVEILLFGIIDEGGRTLYFNPVSAEFRDKQTINTTSQLFGGLTLAFNSIGKEVAKSEEGVDSLQFADRTLIVEYLSPYYLLVLANRSTFFMEQEMEEYLRNLIKIYPSAPKDGSEIPEEVYSKLNSQFFPIISGGKPVDISSN